MNFTLQLSGVSFSARKSSSETNYAFDLDLFAEVDTEKSSHLTNRNLFAIIRKKDVGSDY